MKALECYNTAIDVDPNNVDAFVAKGALQCKLEYIITFYYLVREI